MCTACITSQRCGHTRRPMLPACVTWYARCFQLPQGLSGLMLDRVVRAYAGPALPELCRGDATRRGSTRDLEARTWTR